MLTLGPIAFAAPWLLTGLLLLPALWLVLRVVPPAPRLQAFPAIRLLAELVRHDETAARMPWWLLLLRLALAAAAILAFARPLLNPSIPLTPGAALVLIIDDGWAAAPGWTARQAAAQAALVRAGRENRPVLLLTLAPGADGAPPEVLGPLPADDIAPKLLALQPKPWPSDPVAALAALERAPWRGSAETIWLSDGLEAPGRAALAEWLQRAGGVTVLAPPPADLPMILPTPAPGAAELTVTIRRAGTDAAPGATLLAFDGEGRPLGREAVRFSAGEGETKIALRLPAELRNRLARLALAGPESAGGVALIDGQFRRRPVGLLAPGGGDGGQNLLEDVFYLERALAPFADLRRGGLDTLLAAPPAVILLPDQTTLTDDDRARLARFVTDGGTLVRFAGERLATKPNDSLLPVRLRPGGRQLGSALQWGGPAPLAPFEEGSPFAGLTIPADVTVSRQVLAEPALDLADKSWARLADGTPLVTAAPSGQGRLVLIHVPASAEWSSLPLSGLFIEMLRRVIAGSRGVEGVAARTALPALETLDGFGRLGPAPATAQPLPAGAPPASGPRHPPGFYGTDSTRVALNLGDSLGAPLPATDWPQGVGRRVIGLDPETDLQPALLLAALILALTDLLVTGLLRGVYVWRTRLGRVAGLVVLLTGLGGGATVQAQQAVESGAAGQSRRSDFAQQASLATRLAYMITGDGETDRTALAGLRGLSTIVNRRTAAELAEPMGLDPEADELAFFPLIYWPVSADQRPLSPRAVNRVNQYLRTGGTILFDTRDADNFVGGDRGGRLLRSLLRGIDVPPLSPVPGDHVLTRSFYLMQEFPGRTIGGQLWLERREGGSDEVASVIIGSNDFAAAWAVGPDARPLFAVVPGGETQREWAYRFGINLVMYALTGNYKADQVHIQTILERLGQ